MELNPAQKQAKEAPGGPLLIAAGAGTGKTRTLMARLAHFMETGTLPSKICAITFTNKAAKEMMARLAGDLRQRTGSALTGPESVSDGRPFIGTFHALGLWILRREGKFFGRKPNFVIFDDHDSFSLIKKIHKTLVLPTLKGKKDTYVKKKISLREKPAFFAEKISEIKNKGGVIEKLQKSENSEDVLAVKVFKSYEKALIDNNAFDFDDLIQKPVELFRAHPEILQKYQKKFEAVLVDEYQDVSPMQYELVRLLADKHKNITVVGDDEQLIYGWRYADLKIFLNFEKDWPGARVAFLEENYRSSGNIIAAAAAVARNNRYRTPKNLWTKNPEGERIKLAEAVDEIGEAEWIASEIESCKLKVENLSMAVLYRTNAQSRAIEQALIQRQIPYRIFGGIKFYERKEIKDIVAALRFFVNPKDTISRERLEKNFSKILFQEILTVFSRTDKKITPATIVELFLETTGYLDYLEKNFTNASDRKENIFELLGFAARFDNLQKFLENVSLVQATDMPTTEGGRRPEIRGSSNKENRGEEPIHLSTIHLAKGLEFDNVFIAGCSEGLLPHTRSMDDKNRLEEERRLMYVAMTRARKNLAVSFYDIPSRFLGEIPNELFEFENGNEIVTSEGNEENFISY